MVVGFKCQKIWKMANKAVNSDAFSDAALTTNELVMAGTEGQLF